MCRIYKHGKKYFYESIESDAYHRLIYQNIRLSFSYCVCICVQMSTLNHLRSRISLNNN